ncbi:hypothetical protein SAMN05216420_104115 [Nitrosospira sp. Nl5]|nr:hypothetical protein SAMN05216420_104115 [Nitrosospira sp. Nl5]
MPVIAGLRGRRWRRLCGALLLLLNICWRRHRYGNHRGICVIRGIVRHSETIAPKTITAIITPIKTRPESIAEAITRIEASYTQETYSSMMVVSAMMMMPTMVVAPVMASSVMMTTTAAALVSPAALTILRTGGNQPEHNENQA